MGNYTPEAAPLSAFVLAQTFRFPSPTPTAKKKPAPAGRKSAAPVPAPSRRATKTGKGSRAKPHRKTAAQKFKGIAQKSVWQEEADRAVEAMLDRLDTLAADLVMRPAMREFDLSFEQWIRLLQMISHALFPEVFAKPGEEPSHEGLIPPKGGREAFPLTPRRLKVLVELMAEWDRGDADS